MSTLNKTSYRHYVEEAKRVITTARAMLGDDLGGRSVRDLFLDHFPVMCSSDVDEVIESLRNQGVRIK